MWWEREGVHTLPGRVNGRSSARRARKVDTMWFTNGGDFVFAISTIGSIDTMGTVGTVCSIRIRHFALMTGRVWFLLRNRKYHAPVHEKARSQSQWLLQGIEAMRRKMFAYESLRYEVIRR